MNKKKLWINLAFAAVILLLAGGLFYWRSAKNAANTNPLMAQLTYGDAGTRMDISLDEDKTYDVDTGYYTIHLEVKDGQVRFVDSPCPDHICESYGWLYMEDQMAVCMPAMAVLLVVPRA